MGRQLDRKAAFDLIPSGDWQSIVADYDARRRGVESAVFVTDQAIESAGLVMDQAIALVATAAAIFREGRWDQLPHSLVPSRNIGEAWEVLVKHTPVYRTLSEKLRVFVDWLPYAEALPADVEATMIAIDVTGYVVHAEVWVVEEPSRARAGILGH